MDAAVDIHSIRDYVLIWVSSFHDDGEHGLVLEEYDFDPLSFGLGGENAGAFSGNRAFISTDKIIRSASIEVILIERREPILVFQGATPPLPPPFLLCSRFDVELGFWGVATLTPSETGLFPPDALGDDTPLFGADWFGNGRVLQIAPQLTMALHVFAFGRKIAPAVGERIVCPWWSDGTDDEEGPNFRIESLRGYAQDGGAP